MKNGIDRACAVSGRKIFTFLESPVGRLMLAEADGRLTDIGFGDEPPAGVRGDTPLLTETAKQLRAYFDGMRKHFDLPLAPGGGTDFTRRVWAALAEIPYGQTRGYGEIAASVGRPNAYRAVGSANGRNPISIVIPCHRVINANGALGGYGGGLENKAFLLALEKRVAERSAP